MKTTKRLHRNAAILGLLGTLFVGACTDDPGRHGMRDGGVLAGPPADLGYDPNAFFLTDPPPKMCGLDGTMFPPSQPPGGTPECPGDKNRAGCPCPEVGMQAPCWPGLRANRGLGICSDGVATCEEHGEFNRVWSDCVGYVLPVEGALDGPEACNCFSHGTWKIDNVVPCFLGSPAGADGAISTVGNPPACPVDYSHAPAGTWSNDNVVVDCAGHFKLCYTIRAGNPMAPSPSDCIVSQVCSEGNYTQVNQAQAFPPLASWLSSSPAQRTCATKFAASGGYGEMSVDGVTVACDQVNRVFNRIPYCPLSCSVNPSAPECAQCQSGQSGNF